MEPIGGEDPAAQYDLLFGKIHIMRAVKIVAYIGLVLNPLWTIYMALASPIAPYDFAIVAMCLYALILVAMQKEKPRLLIPFLIFNALIIGGRALYLFILLFAINSNEFWAHWAKEHPGFDPTAFKVMLIIHFVLNIAKLLMNCLFEHIIYRGYLFMLERAEATPLLQSPAASVPVPNAV